MELKKEKKADLEGKRNTFFMIGLVVALGVTLAAFEWTTAPNKANSLGALQSVDVEEEFIPITREPELQPPPPETPPPVIDILTVVEDDVEIEDELIIEDSEADDETVVDIQPLIKANEEEEVEEDQILYIVEEQAEFPGGLKALYNYINTHVQYPVIAMENGIQGTVYVKFVVDKLGKVSNAEVLRPVDRNLDSEALRVINSLPDFKPGKQGGRAVKVYYNATIKFELQ